MLIRWISVQHLRVNSGAISRIQRLLGLDHENWAKRSWLPNAVLHDLPVYLLWVEPLAERGCQLTTARHVNHFASDE